MAAALHQFWLSRGMLGEGRRWLERALSAAPREPTVERANALFGITIFVELQGEPQVGMALVEQERALIEQLADPLAHSMIAYIDGWTALMRGDFQRARTCLEAALDTSRDLVFKARALLLVGWAHELSGDSASALMWHEKALALAESHGESVYRSYALRAIGITRWRLGEPEHATQMLREGFRLSQLVNEPRNAAACLEALAWVAGDERDPRRAVVLMAAAERLGHTIGSSASGLPLLIAFHEQCERRAREALDAAEFHVAHEEGHSMRLDGVIAYALGEDDEPRVT
jgi:tetratricopeptide (TPR) repeat protein